MEGILGFVCSRQPFFHGHFRSNNKISLNKPFAITIKSYFKYKNRKNFSNGSHYNCSDLYNVFLILFNFCLALLHKHSEKTLGASR